MKKRGNTWKNGDLGLYALEQLNVCFFDRGFGHFRHSVGRIFFLSRELRLGFLAWF